MSISTSTSLSISTSTSLSPSQHRSLPLSPRLFTFCKVWDTLVKDFGMDEAKFDEYSSISKEDQLKGYEMMQLCRQFENACNQAYMQGKIRGFMHLDNGQVNLLGVAATVFFLDNTQNIPRSALCRHLFWSLSLSISPKLVEVFGCGVVHASLHMRKCRALVAFFSAVLDRDRSAINSRGAAGGGGWDKGEGNTCHARHIAADDYGPGHTTKRWMDASATHKCTRMSSS